MFLVASILAIALSLSSLDDYKYTTPSCSSNQIAGIGMGAAADYTIVRAEDVAFLREAYAERTAVPFAVEPDGTNALDRPILARPSEHKWPTHSVIGSYIFVDGVWGGCFSLSYTTNEMPYCELSVNPGSFVRPEFRFSTGVNFVPVEAFPETDWDEFRAIASNAVAQGGAFTTNEIPTVWHAAPYVVGTNRICSLYAALPLFDTAAQQVWNTGGARRVTVYDVSELSAMPSSYDYAYSTNESEGVVYSWKKAYGALPTSTTNYESLAQGTWSGGFSEYRLQEFVNEFSCARTSNGAGPFPLVALGEYERTRKSMLATSVTNAVVWVSSPVLTNAQDEVEILQAVLSVHLTQYVTISRSWYNPSLPAGDPARSVNESTNIVNRATMCLPVQLTLDTSAGTYDYFIGPRWRYRMDAPMYYIQNRATALLGGPDDYWPSPARVPNDVIAATGTADGAATGGTRVDVSTSFYMRVFMVYRRTYNAKLETDDVGSSSATFTP